MMSFFNRNFTEIAASRALTLYGGFLSFGHIFTFLYWSQSSFTLKLISSDDPNPLCWPYFFSCGEFRLSIEFLNIALYGYLGLAAAVAVLFFSRRHIVLAYFGFLTALLIKLFFYVQSYRMMGNYHYMFFIISTLYLFAPAKKDVIRLMIVAFYIAASSLKLNREWLSGSALYGVPMLIGALLQLACGYVVILEMGISLLLLSRRRILFYFALSQFALFHLFSWHIVGFFYPCLMFGILSIFVLCFHESPFEIRRLRRTSYALIGLFFFAQLMPYFYKGDTALTGEGRFWALNMFDVKSECEFRSFARFGDRTEDLSWRAEGIGPRIKCDPIIYMSFTRNLCNELKRSDDFRGLDIFLAAKRTSDREFKKIFQRRNVCDQDLGFNLLFPNTWIQFEDLVVPEKDSIEWSPSNIAFVNDEMLTNQKSSISAQYRENLRKTGVSASSFTCAKPQILWEKGPLNVGVHTASKASPIVDASGVYVGSDSGWFFAYNHDGTLKWKFNSGDAYGGIHATAALDDDTVYVGTYDGVLYALAKDSGTIRWFHKLGLALGASPTLIGDDILVSVELVFNGYMARIRRRDGAMVWHSEKLGEQGHSSPTVDSEAGLVFGGANNGRFVAFELDTGALRWEATGMGPIKDTAVSVNSSLFFTSWDGFLYSYESKTGTLRWAVNAGRSSQSSPTLVPGENLLIYGVDQKGFQASQAGTGKVKWTLPFPGRNHMTSALVTPSSGPAAFTAWLPCAEKTLCSVDTKTGRVLSRTALSAHYTSTPVTFGNSMYLALDAPGGLAKIGCGK